MNSEPKRIYHIGIDARFYRRSTGGIGRYTREIIYHLAKLDRHNQYSVFLTADDMKEWDLEQENFHPVEVAAAHFSKAEQLEFWRVLQRSKCDLVHFLNFNHPLFYRRPFVTTLHDFTLYLFPTGRSQKSRIRRIAFVHLFKHSLFGAKKVIAISEQSARDAEQIFKLPHARMEVIYEGGPEKSNLSFAAKGQVQEYLSTTQPYLLFLSQWRPHKGIVTLIEAFNLFKEKTGLPHVLVLAGRQDYSQQEVKAALNASAYLKDIVTPGFVPEELLSGLYHYAEACIIPSEYEGFGLPVLEAFTYETPVIVAKNSSLPEVAGEAALYFPTRDAQALAERIEQLVTSPELATQLLQKAQAQIKKFSWEKCAYQTLQVYLSILEKRH